MGSNVRASTLLKILNNCGGAVDFTDTVHWIINCTGYDAVVINIDEASGLSELDLGAILQWCGYAICRGLRLYFTVTGVYDGSILTAVTRSMMQLIRIVLPPLTMESSIDVLQCFGAISGSGLSPFARQLVWLAGGIPRYLSYLVHALAASSGVLTDRGELPFNRVCEVAAYCSGMTHKDFIGVLARWSAAYPARKDRSIPAAEVLNNLISLVVAEVPVEDPSAIFLDRNRSTTLDKALRAELAYCAPGGYVTIPPILLKLYYASSIHGDSIRTVVLLHMDSVLHHRDNESLYISVLMHRLRAHKLIGREKMALTTLLGAAVPKYSSAMVSLADTQDNYAVDSTNVTKRSFDGACLPGTAVSAPQAEFADARVR
jgi:hypothetical protein